MYNMSSPHHEMIHAYKVSFFVFHLLGSVYLIVPAFWWTICIFKDFYKYKANPNGTPFISRMFYLGPVGQKPLESWFKLLWGTFMALLMVLDYVLTRDPTGIGRVHIAYLLGYGSIGFIELLVHWNVLLLDSIEVLAFELTFFMKAVLTYNHLDALTIVESTAHVLVVLNSVGAMTGVLLQCSWNGSASCALVRPFFVFLDGLWMVFFSCILYSPFQETSWDARDPHDVMLLVAAYTWLCLILFYFMLLLGGFVRVMGSFGRVSAKKPCAQYAKLTENGNHSIDGVRCC